MSFRWSAFLVLLLGIRAFALQDLLQNTPTDDLEGAPSGGVYVHDSATALDRMALAARLENLKEWPKAGEIYQEVIEKYRDRVVPSGSDEAGVIDQYKSVLARVNQHLANWPPEGLAVYRTRYELPAKNLLDSARPGDLGPLHETFTRYFVTDSGKAAGMRLIDDYFELGDFPAAAWIGQALLMHPNIDVERPAILFRVGLAAHLAGDDVLANDTLQALTDKFPAAVGTIAGRDVTLAAELKSDLASVRPAQSLNLSALADDSWPMFGGDATRGRPSFATARPGAKLFSVTLPQPDWKIVADPTQRTELVAQDQAYRFDGKALDVFPVADRGQLFFQDNAHVYAMNIQTGTPLPGWLATYPSSNGQYVYAKAWNMPVAQPSTLTLTDTAVFAVLNMPDPLAANYMVGSNTGASLVCLDRQTGKEIWTFQTRDLTDDALKPLHIGGSPLVVGSNVYIAAKNFKGTGYEDCYVLCLDAATGAYRWACYVAGSPNTGNPIQGQNDQSNYFDLPTHLSYSSGRVFVATDLGAVAAIDAFSGSVAWLDIYRTSADVAANAPMPMMGRFWMGGGFGGGFNNGPQQAWEPPLPWTANAPIVHDGNLFVLPADGKAILVYDAGSGKLVKKLNKADCCRTISDLDSDTASAEPVALLAVLDGVALKDNGQTTPQDLLLVCTRDSVCALRWRQYDPDKPSASLAWATSHSAGDSIRGRPFVTADSVFIPAPKHLIRAALATGSALQFYPAEGDYPADEGAGNVLVCGDHVVIAGQNNLAVYTDVSLAENKLQQEITAAPADPDARLRYAEVMFLASKTDQAAQRLDEAIHLLNAAPAAADSDARDRAFADANNFAVKISSVDPTFAAGLFDRAAALARSPGQQVAYRLSRARALRARGADFFPAAIKLYQEILADNALRTAPATPEKPAVAPTDPAAAAPAPDMTQAAFLAKSEIDAILREPAGRAAYRSFEHDAQTRLAAAVTANNPDELAAVADQYPNSAVATRAQDLAAAAFAAAKRPLDATVMLRRIYLRPMDNYARAAVLVSLARQYLQLPDGAAAAAERLAHALRLDPSITVSPRMTLADGSPVAGATAMRVLASLRKLAVTGDNGAAALPNLGLPSHADEREYLAKFHKQLNPFGPTDAVIEDVGTLVQPDQQFARTDRIITWTGGRGLSIYSPTGGAAISTNADISGAPAGAAWINSAKDLAVWTSTKLTCIDGDSFHSRWTLDFAALPLDPVLAQSAPKTTPRLIQQMDPRILRRRQRGALQLQLNRPFVAQPLNTGGEDVVPDTSSADDEISAGAPETILTVQPLSNRLIVSTSKGRVAAVNLATGAVVWQIRLTDHAADRVAATRDFTVIKATDSAASTPTPAVRLAVLDTQSGRLLARRLYTTDDGQYPVNIALGDDGTLAISMPDQIAMRDLYDVSLDGMLDGHEVVSTGPLAGRPFNHMTRPDQLLIYHGQVLALCLDGKQLNGYDAETGQPHEYRQRQDPAQEPSIVAMELNTGDGTDQTALRVSDGYVYAFSPSCLAAYNLDHPEVNWGPHKLGVPGAAHQLFLGRDYLMILNTADEDPDDCWLCAFSRAPVANKPGVESGVLVFTPRRTDSARILAWAPVDGGMCYLGGDHRLHVLRGAANLDVNKPQ